MIIKDNLFQISFINDFLKELFIENINEKIINFTINKEGIDPIIF